MRPDERKPGLSPVVQAIINDVTLTSVGGVRIPKDKFMTWIVILRRQHRQATAVFLQLGAIGVEFARQRAVFVSDQFFILAAVGLDPAKVGALISPEEVETRVASMFVHKYQQSQGLQTASMMAPPGTRVRRPSTTKVGPESSNSVDVNADGNPAGHGPSDSDEQAIERTTVSTVDGQPFHSDDPAENTQVTATTGPKESTRLERTPVIRRRSPRVVGLADKKE